MANGSIIQQGRFTSDGNARTLNIRSDVDWMSVYNETQIGATNNVGVQYYWQRGMAAATGVRYFKSGGGNALNTTVLASPNGFTLVNTGDAPTITVSPNQITNISNASPPRVTSTAHALLTGDIVRMSNMTGAAQLGGIDFRVTRVDADNFDLTWMAAVVTAAAPGASSRIRKISHESVWQPKNRVITAITQAASAVVTFAAPHNFKVGELVRFHLPRVTALAYGMTELDGVSATVTAISTANNTITVNVNTTAFTAFAFPLTASAQFTFASVSPIGENVAYARENAVDELQNAMDDTAIIGMRLAGGADTPGGANADVMYWVAGTSFSVDNS
jgi:hypothetical protein